MSLEVSGKLLEILPKQSGEGRNGIWEKQSFVIETQDQYPKKVCFDVWGDRINMLEGLTTGDDLKVAFDIESREYNGKWYTNAKAWRLDNQNQGQGSDQGSSSSTPDDPFPEDLMNSSGGDDNDLPF